MTNPEGPGIGDYAKKLIHELTDSSQKTLNDLTDYSGSLVPDWFTVQFLINNTICLAPLFSYGSTLYSIHKKQSTTGFSIDICCTMMVSSILRINFYFIQPFEYTLLKQAIVMIFIHVVLLKVALAYKLSSSYNVNNLHEYDSVVVELKNFYLDELQAARKPVAGSEKATFGGDRENRLLGSARLVITGAVGTFLIIFKNFVKFFDPHYKRSFEFWQWNNEARYWRFLAEFAVVNTICTFVFRKYALYGSFIGSVSLFIESLLPLPQILLLNRIKTINGFKTILLFSWYCGDLTKIGYLLFGAKNISFIFIFFALFQMMLDIVIGFQYIYYKYYHNVDYKSFDIELQQQRLRRSIELIDAANDSIEK